MKRLSISKNQRGSGALFIFVGLMIVAGVAVALMQYNKISQYQLTQAVAKMEIDAAVASVHRGIREALVTYPTDKCLPSPMGDTQVKSYRRFDKDAPIIEFELDEAKLKSEQLGCLLTNEMIARLTGLKIKISPLQENRNTMQRKVEVVVEATSKAAGEKFVRRAKIARLYQFQPLSISRFGLLFMNDISDGSFISLDGEDTKLRVFSNVFYAGMSNPTLTQLVPGTAARLMFERSNFARFKSVSTYGQAMNDFRLSFRNGLETSALDDSFVDKFLPSAASANWKQPFDYFPQYHSEAYPIPYRDDGATVSYCGGGEPYSPSRAAITTIPSPGLGPEKTSHTCDAGSSHRALLFIDAAKDFTIKFNPDDRNFCGIVVAKTLTIEIESEAPYIYGLIGNFYVNNLVIRNLKPIKDGVSEVRLYNPSDGVMAEGLQPMKLSFDQLGLQFRELASSTGRNFFIPIAKNPQFLPWNAKDYLRSCSATDAGPPYAYRSIYQPLSELSEYEIYRQDAAGSLYALEAF